MGDKEGIDPEALECARELQSVAQEIANNEDVAKYVMKSFYNVDIATTVDDDDDDEMLEQFPSDLKQLDERSDEIFAKCVYNMDIATTVDEMLEQFPSDLKQLIFAKDLKEGSEEVKNIRLMVVGNFGVGKTSLVHNLIKDLRDKNIKPYSTTGIPYSTTGINLHRCQLMTNGEWHMDKEQKTGKYHSRIKIAIRDVMKPSNTDVHYDLPNMQLVPDEEVSEVSETVSEKPLDPLAAIAQKVQRRKHDDGIRDFLKLVREKPANKQDVPVNIHVSVETKTDITVSVWDFEGQTLYYSMHQFFLNRSSIYLVLMDMTKDLNDHVTEDERSGPWCSSVEDCTYLDVFKFWLNAIYMYSGYRSMTGKIHPTVILVGSRKDEMTGSDGDREVKNNKYFDRALGLIVDSPIFAHIYHKKFLVNNLSPEDPVYDEIRREILTLSQKEDYWEDRYPIRWIMMEQSLDKLRYSGKRVLDIKAIDNANQLNIQPLDKKELELFLEFQHRHGNILYFNTEQLKHTVVLDPQWIIEVFKRFITHEQRIRPKLLKQWTVYEKIAILTPEVFKTIMDNSQEDIKENREIVLNYMEYFDVMAKPLIREEADEAINHIDFHIVPCRLKNPPPPISRFTSPKNCKKTPVLCFAFVENFMPPSFFHRLVAVCISLWPISTKLGPNEYKQLYNGLAVFDIHKTKCLTIWYKDHIIYARISCLSKDHKTDFNVGLCQEVRLTLLKSLRKIVIKSLENPRTPIAFEEHIQCPEMEESVHNEGMFRLVDFMYDRELECRAASCKQTHTVQRKDAMSHWYKTAIDSLDNDDDLNTPVSESDLSKAANEIGYEYWTLGIVLGFSNHQMNTLSVTYDLSKDRCTFVFQYMVSWMRREGKKATKQRLNKAIHAARLCWSTDDKITLYEESALFRPEVFKEIMDNSQEDIIENRKIVLNDMQNLDVWIPDQENTTVYKKGYIMRKCCVDPDGRKTAVGKRAWNMFYAVLRDMILYLYNDEQAPKKSVNMGSHNAIRAHHCYATKATDYSKKQHVFRLRTADWAEYLFQTSNTKECEEWINVMNIIAASLSTPPLPWPSTPPFPWPMGLQKKFQRPFLPATYTRLTMADQLIGFELRLSQMELRLQEHRQFPPEKGSKASMKKHYIEKETYLMFEIDRLKEYCYLLQAKLHAQSQERLDALLVETTIGEDEEGINKSKRLATVSAANVVGPQRGPVQRSASDRCGKQVKNADDVEFQPAKKEHSSFSDTIKDIKPLMEEDKGQQLANNDTKTRLREMCVTYGRTSENVQEFCKVICKRFLQVHGVIDSYPAYTIGNETNIVFVLTIKDNITDIHLKLVKFDIDTIIKTVSSDFCEDDLAITEDFRENYKNMERLNECILNNTEDLMHQHKYLNVIRGGSNKQMKGSKRELCLVVYVHAKGFIPIDEDPFKKSYDGIHVKVLEGRFTPYMNHGEEIRQGSFTLYSRADVVLNKLRMGCKIEGHQNGTLGVFIEHPSYGMCGITCAHVAISATEMEECKSENGRLLWQKIDPSKKYIHQPSRINDDLNQFGQIVEVIYKEGKASETGFEIALIQIEKRHPDSGKFSTRRSESVELDFEFTSGKTCGPTRFNTNNRCFKVGSATGFTEGTIEMCAPNTVRTDKHYWDYEHLRVTLYNQIFVRPIREAFAVPGDSGSPVFVKEEGTGEPVCIGLVEGGLNGGLVVVTPITKILEELGISQLKAFPQNVMQELQQIKSTFLNILTTQYAELQQIKSTLNVFQAQFEELRKEIKQNNRTHTT